MAVELEAPICEPGGSGLLMPLGGDEEQRLPSAARTVIYGIALAYSFAGVSVVADLFMNSIEVITAKVIRVKRPGSERLMTRKLWNDTVANLTLMALGSSAPEIMLSVVETLNKGQHSGPLGPSTILGSAAFNLMVIIAACIMAIPCTEVRCIDALPVFYVTAVFSILAYVWLLIIVDVITPNVVDIWEAVVTLLLLPVLVALSYACDKGWLCGGGDDESASTDKDEAAAAHPTVDGGTGGSGSALSVVPGQQGAGGATSSEMGETAKASEDAQALLGFSNDAEELEVAVGLEQKTVKVEVKRFSALSGTVSCAYSCRGLSAVPGFDYEVGGTGQLEFEDGMVVAEIELTALPRRPGQKKVQFQLILENPEDAESTVAFRPDTDGDDEQSVLTVTITNSMSAEGSGGSCLSMIDMVVCLNALKLGASTWKENIINAAMPQEWSEGGVLDRIIIIMMYPWALLYALLVPPANLFGGWLCFVLSLVHIFGLTAVIVDLAEMFGCVAGVKDAMTAISFVALGTSMPDFFASKTAALSDDNADASIVNVTGSNSVNVFLGIGLPWTIASIYWAVNGPTEEWKMRYPQVASKYSTAVFVVESGDLSFSVASFSVVALITLGIIMWRRRTLGGELGGPFVAKLSTSFTMVALWASYIGICGWRFENSSADAATQVGVAAGVLGGVLVFCALFTVIVWLIHGLRASTSSSVAPGDSEAR
eukprot:TRINITY_DN29890_c0_g1_i1.p1 TRINITY_DN29890_c0_g1~~TRINITY_DN29890_c0_g1_i1.p1  ORF type:complete len:724 (+),score=136.15 TRINITY_DN29890_c0_g1_i1:38-2173(+)